MSLYIRVISAICFGGEGTQYLEGERLARIKPRVRQRTLEEGGEEI